MKQVKQYALIPPTAVPNQVVGLPSDLKTEAEVASSPGAENPVSTGQQNDAEGNTSISGQDTEIGLPTPAIIQIKSQTVNILEDGTATIDVVLEVEDIQGVFEYDLRVAKDAGTV